eukprot:s1036_g19.t1
MIVDATSDVDPAQAESKRTFMFAVQGPLVDLHKGLSRLVNQRVRYRARGTGLIWLDYDQKKSNAIKVHNIARRKLLLQGTNPPFDCASCKGSLHAADFAYLLSLLTACILAVAMLPVIIKVALISGNGAGHVFAALACKELFLCTANNQWNIGAELGSDPMESAFARTLTAGIKGVAMVLDQEVQPLTSDSAKCRAARELHGFSCKIICSLVHSVSIRVYFSALLPKLYAPEAETLRSFAHPLPQKSETSVLRSLVSL